MVIPVCAADHRKRGTLIIPDDVLEDMLRFDRRRVDCCRDPALEEVGSMGLRRQRIRLQGTGSRCDNAFEFHSIQLEMYRLRHGTVRCVREVDSPAKCVRVSVGECAFQPHINNLYSP